MTLHLDPLHDLPELHQIEAALRLVREMDCGLLPPEADLDLDSLGEEIDLADLVRELAPTHPLPRV
ncbi:hypothetical protein [Isoptericola haloaureus]|uniref:Acyl carrier protein n=1 Tax=Isoptericola haloaureus TaxID=1542902 RepID=A0ABU7Z754_9MICO